MKSEKKNTAKAILMYILRDISILIMRHYVTIFKLAEGPDIEIKQLYPSR